MASPLGDVRVAGGDRVNDPQEHKAHKAERIRQWMSRVGLEDEWKWMDDTSIRADGRTNYQRRKGKKFGGSIVEFGESIMFLRSKSVGKDKYDSRWENGIWLGIREESGENIIGTKDGVLKARTIRRKATQDERWKDELFDAFRGVPWQPVLGGFSWGPLTSP